MDHTRTCTYMDHVFEALIFLTLIFFHEQTTSGNGQYLARDQDSEVPITYCQRINTTYANNSPFGNDIKEARLESRDGQQAKAALLSTALQISTTAFSRLVTS